ncbi:type II toxin-antitoxin system RelE/ParE family toxin [Paraglaciecola sp.]|uniref:type II toxin-antitoxin system RelE/ParE family toxin n=1 Tax=Paraglaciecola sp. TaxID=1920173 RepID=UPI003299824B
MYKQKSKCLTLKLSPLAEEGLFKIISTTIKSWGNTQAKVYAQTLDAALLKLAQYPDFGKERNEVYSGAKSFPVEKHIVFYQVSDTGIDVARILHQRMAPSKHF